MTQESADATTEGTMTAETSQGVEAAAEQTSSPEVTDSAPSSGAAEQEATTRDRIVDDFLKAFGDGSEETAAAPDDQDQPAAQDQEKTSDQPDADQKVAADDATDDKFRIPDEVFKSLPDGVKRRIGHLNATAKKAQRDLAEATGRLETAQPVIERMRSLETFVTENRIDPKNLGAAFGMMAKMARGDFKGFLSDIQPWVDAAKMAAGEAIHPDLKAHVDNGEMTEEMARRVTADRLKAARIEHQNKALAARQQQAQESTAQQSHVQTILSVVQKREAELRTDPDFASLEPAIKRQMAFALKRGVPRSPEEALALVNEAFEIAKESRPKPVAPPKATIPQPGASQMDRGRPKPKSTKEAIMASLLDMQGGS